MLAMTSPKKPPVIREQRVSFLRERRIAKGWSEKELAIRAGISSTQVHHLETRQRRWNEDMKARLSAALGCAPDDLFVDPNGPPPEPSNLVALEHSLAETWSAIPSDIRPKVLEMLRAFARKP